MSERGFLSPEDALVLWTALRDSCGDIVRDFDVDQDFETDKETKQETQSNDK